MPSSGSPAGIQRLFVNGKQSSELQNPPRYVGNRTDDINKERSHLQRVPRLDWCISSVLATTAGMASALVFAEAISL
jgi:hypothetical protein